MRPLSLLAFGWQKSPSEIDQLINRTSCTEREWSRGYPVELLLMKPLPRRMTSGAVSRLNYRIANCRIPPITWVSLKNSCLEVQAGKSTVECMTGPGKRFWSKILDCKSLLLYPIHTLGQLVREGIMQSGFKFSLGILLSMISVILSIFFSIFALYLHKCKGFMSPHDLLNSVQKGKQFCVFSIFACVKPSILHVAETEKIIQWMH